MQEVGESAGGGRNPISWSCFILFSQLQFIRNWEGYNWQQSFLGSLCYLGPPWLATVVTVTALITVPSIKAVYVGSLELFS